MPEPASPEKMVVTVAAGYREEQIRPFLASLQRFSPDASLKLIVDRFNPEFLAAARGWFPNCDFYLLPPMPLRDFARRRKWARSILKRAARWTRSPVLGGKLLNINFHRHLVIRDVLDFRHLERTKVLLCDSRDVVFQADPFSSEWPALWICEEDKRIRECGANSSWVKIAGGEADFQEAKDRPIVCAGVIGGRGDRINLYLQKLCRVIERLLPQIPFGDGDQGIHNQWVWTRNELGFTVLPNGCRLAVNLGHTKPANLIIENDQVRLRNHTELPAILHQYDRHSELAALIHSRWVNARPDLNTPSPI